jgi:16S rRNA (adenine1518-N6/adenine1519-N6)-dimethyltransferase
VVDFSSQNGSLLKQTKDLLRQYELRAKKGLGQHFLVNSSILKKIMQTAEISRSDLILEIGPGIGILTRELVKEAGWVIAVELDREMVAILNDTLSSYQNYSLLNRDILEIEPSDLIREERAKFPPAISGSAQYKLVANLPYYITQPIIRHFCEARLKPQVMVIMVQKEVAENIAARPGHMSILAISVQFYGKPEIIRSVPAGNFYPAPKVDSAILKISLYPRPRLDVTTEKSFFKIVRAGFCARRKQVANSLSQGLSLPRTEVLSLMRKAGVSPQKRAEVLTLEEWASLERSFVERINK